MKIPTFALCFLAMWAAGSSNLAPQNPATSTPASLQAQPDHPTTPPNRKNLQVSAPLPFTGDLSTQPLGAQAFSAYQSGFPTAFGSFPTHNPSVPNFSVDPMISSGSISTANPSAHGPYPLQGQPSVGVSYSPYIRAQHSLTRISDDNLPYGGISLSSGVFPKLKPKDRCRVVQQQAVQVANNLVKRQNKVIFKELMDYILKSKFLIGMTEVKLNRVLRRKFVALMKRYSTLTDDNIRLISSEDDEIIDSELEDEDDLNEGQLSAGFGRHSTRWSPDNERGFEDPDDDGIIPTVVPDPDGIPSLSDHQTHVPDDATDTPSSVPTDTAPSDKTAPPEKKSWLQRLFSWKQRQRALKGAPAPVQPAASVPKNKGPAKA